MRIISPKRLRDFWIWCPASKSALQCWLVRTSKAQWRNMVEVRQIFPHADMVKVASGNSVVVFNAGGNEYRIVASIHFNTGIVYVLRVMRHTEYSRERWKDDL